MDRISTGLKGLDDLLGGGFPEKTIILVSGGPGAGKTLVSLNYLIEGAAQGERCCYVSLNEEKSDLLRACSGIRSLKKAEKYLDKNLAFEHFYLGKDATVDYFVKLFSSYPQVDRLVIDNLNKLLIYAENKNSYRTSLSNLVAYLRDKARCAILICESEDGLDTGSGEAFECDGVVRLSFLEMEEKPRRILEVHKLRYTSFEPRVPHELVIDGDGIRLTKTRVL
jgi:circadian clock protein KaiC